jgi:hypothetical protein
MSEGFRLPDDLTGTIPADLYVPVRINPAQLSWGSYNLTPVARLAPGVSPASATATVRGIFEQLQKDHPDGALGGPGYAIRVTPLHQEVVKGVATALWMLGAAVALATATTILIKMGKARFAWITLMPMAWLFAVTMTAGWQKLFSPEPKLGFLAHAHLIAGHEPAISAAERAMLVRNECMRRPQKLRKTVRRGDTACEL